MERTRWLLQLTALGAGWQQVDMIQCEGERNTGGKGEQTGNEKDATVQPKRWRLLFLLCYYFSDLPCMHLDPGVNRLGLNITSVHQTDSRPVTPDIVFPICVILWSQEDGLKKKHSKTKRSIHFTYTRAHIHMHPGSEKPVLVPCLEESLERGQTDYKTANHANERGREQFQQPSCIHSGQNTSGK